MNLTNSFRIKLIFYAITSLLITQQTHTCYLASASNDGTIKIWDILKPSGQEKIRTLKSIWLDRYGKIISSIAFNPKKPNILASGTYNTTITIWDISRKKGDELKMILRGHKLPVSSVTFHPENHNILISGSDNGTIKIWDLSKKENKALLKTFKATENRISSIKFNNKSQNIIIVSTCKTSKYWDISDPKNPKKIQSLKVQNNNHILRYPKNPNISASILWKKNSIEIKEKCKKDETKVIKTLIGHKGNINQIIFAPAIKNKFIIQDQKERIQFLQNNSENLEIKQLAINLGNWKKLKANNILF